ncbi:MAG: NupC/NupG family nucleoside CNT transporter, partial [Sediminibacterium sp.]|nr:NupC/NupG family nucleoside CNT transporter [Sediminibacterium sp.]
MNRLQGIIGICLILGIAFLFSNNKRKINLRLVISGLLLQLVIGVLVLKVPIIRIFFQKIGMGISKMEGFAREGVNFVASGFIVNTPNGFQPFGNASHSGFVFVLNISATIILVCILVAILYQLKVMQAIIQVIAKGMNKIMKVSGAEALSNVASAFVGQVEAQVMIRPYLKNMTKSELLASMSGSLACIAGSILIVYANMGAKVEYLLAASLMAAPGSLVIAKIIYPETIESETFGTVKLKIEKPYTNLLDAISHGVGDGIKLSVNVVGMLIGFIALITLINYGLGKIYPELSLNFIFSKLFYPIAWAMGVPYNDVANVSTLLGQKLTINEFIAFNNLTTKTVPIITEKGLAIVTFAICGFANFSSVGMLIGGIGSLAPERKKDLAQLGFKALLCGSLASYLSATIAGILIN